MSEWTKLKFNKIADIYDGPHATPKPSASGPNFLGIKSITSDGVIDFSMMRHISWEEYPRWTKRVTPGDGDIVFSYEATLHQYCIIPAGFVGCLGRRMALIRIRNDRANNVFVYYYLRSTKWRTYIEQKIIHGSTVDRISIKDFPEYEIELPERAVQDKIVSVISNYDNLIENNNRRIAILEEMAQKLYREWFVHFHFPGHENVKMVESEIGMIPEGWELKSLANIAYITMGQSPKSSYYNEIGEGLPFQQGVTYFNSLIPDHKTYSTSGSRIANSGDILFSVRAPVGRTNLADRELVLGRGISSIRHQENHQAYLLFALRNTFNKPDLIGGGSIFNSVTKNDMCGIKLLTALGTVEDLFEHQAKPIVQQLVTLNTKNTNLRKTRDLLLPRLIYGDIDVSKLNIPIREEQLHAELS